MQPPELFDVSFSKRLFRLCGRHLFWVEFHQLGHTGAFAGSGSSALGESVSVHNGAVISLMGFAEFRRHGQFIIQVGKAAVRVKTILIEYESFLKTFKQLPDSLEEFNIDGWNSLVEYATVYSADDIRFTFKNGQEIKA